MEDNQTDAHSATGVVDKVRMADAIVGRCTVQRAAKAAAAAGAHGGDRRIAMSTTERTKGSVSQPTNATHNIGRRGARLPQDAVARNWSGRPVGNIAGAWSCSSASAGEQHACRSWKHAISWPASPRSTGTCSACNQPTSHSDTAATPTRQHTRAREQGENATESTRRRRIRVPRGVEPPYRMIRAALD